MTTASVALVGDRSQGVRAHARIALLVEALRRRDGIVLDPYWIPSEEAEDAAALDGIPEAAHAEYGPDGELVVVALECSLVGHEGALCFEPGSLIQGVMGVERSVERYHCAYGVARPYIERLEAAGVRFGARDDQGEVRALELGGHPFFLATLFQPELAGDGRRAHPVIRAFATACAQHARDRAGAVAA